MSLVDGPIAQGLGWLTEMTLGMLIKFGAVVLFTPIFILPGLVLAFVGGWCGQVYIKAQLSVKREMSNARSPVLSHFGAAIAGLSLSTVFHCVYTSSQHISSIHSCIWRPSFFPEGVHESY
jgi:hypothetical protein